MLTTYEYESLIDYTPSLNHMLIITGSDKKQSKIIVNTNQVLFFFSKLLILGFFSDLNIHELFFRHSKCPTLSENIWR